MTTPKSDAAEWIEAIAFNLATASRVVEPTEVKAAIAAHRDQVLTEAAGILGAYPDYRGVMSVAASLLLAARSAQTPQET